MHYGRHLQVKIQGVKKKFLEMFIKFHIEKNKAYVCQTLSIYILGLSIRNIFQEINIKHTRMLTRNETTQRRPEPKCH